MLTHAKVAFLLPPHNNHTIALKMKHSVPTYPAASNSVILSLAAYFGYMFPELPHPSHPNTYKKVDDTYPSPYLSLHPLFELWVVTFCEAVLRREGIREGDTLLLVVRVGEEYGGMLGKYKEEWEEVMVGSACVKDVWKAESCHKNRKVGLINVS